ncbi:TonB-dependent receptor [Methylobacillus arboreus]|uniref:TonB-dependent receptor domain-containing protein n=1 Tax=Methylobacillus arboreus TaxID=755170 RepID=UPI001E5AC77F|nr:TonB-dependent receptor [Methylobacillus arboreus]MCB5189486.1 TonB-dependent receptor [Methylobacillus arboreus]
MHAHKKPQRSRLALKLSSSLIAVSLGISLPAALQAAEAQPQQQAAQREYHIPAEPLTDALNQFAKQAGVNILFTPEQVRNLRSHDLEGSYTTEAGLSTLLQGTGLVARRSAAGYTLERTSQSAADNKPLALEAAEQTALEEANSAALGVVVVTSRNREEIAQDIPIPVSVFGAEKLDRERIVTIDDLTRITPGLTATIPNSRRSGISIRGIGKTTVNEAMEAGVGVIVDDVYLSHPGMSFLDFTDIDRVEVMRGPQGTLKGKNTTLGVVQYVSKEPTFTRQAYFEGEVGAQQNGSDFPGAMRARGSISDALVDGVAAYRASFFFDRQEGDLENTNPNTLSDQRFHERNRRGGKVQLLLTPTEDFSAKFSVDYSELSEYSNTRPFQEDPTAFATGANRPITYSSRLARGYFNGYQPIIGSKDKLDVGQVEPIKTRNYGASAKLDWNLGSHVLTSITAYRKYSFTGINDLDQTRFDIAKFGAFIDTKQWSQEFRLASDIGEVIDYQVGFFYLHSETNQINHTQYGSDAGAFYANAAQYTALSGNPSLLQQSLNGLRSYSRFTPETDSYAAFGQLNWHLTEKATLTLGLRNTYEIKDSTGEKWTEGNDGGFGDATAEAIRSNVIGNVYDRRDGKRIKDNSVSWLISPNYKVNDDLMFYASAAGGEKSGGVSFITGTGQPLNADPEKVLDFELGFKGLFLDRKLMLNTNFYRTRVRGYQSTTTVIDPSSTSGYSSQLGNIPEITATGVELEGAYRATDRWTFTFAGAYNRAKYSDWDGATCPTELNLPITTTCDNTGRQISSAPKLTGIFGFHYTRPIWGGLKGHAFMSTVIRSKQNLDILLSEYGEQGGYSVTDGGFGIIGGKKDNWELNIVGKNIFDKVYTTSVGSYNATTPVLWDGIGQRRYLGVVFRTKF